MFKKAIVSFALSIAATLAHADEQSRLEEILECTEDTTSERDLFPTRMVELQDGFSFAHGLLGYHTTWGVIFDMNTAPPTVYETVEGNALSLPFGRMEVPESMKRALVECGADWRGLWVGEWPDYRE